MEPSLFTFVSLFLSIFLAGFVTSMLAVVTVGQILLFVVGRRGAFGETCKTLLQRTAPHELPRQKGAFTEDSTTVQRQTGALTEASNTVQQPQSVAKESRRARKRRQWKQRRADRLGHNPQPPACGPHAGQGA